MKSTETVVFLQVFVKILVELPWDKAIAPVLLMYI